jgi:penicillin-binding protein 1B
MPRMSLSQRFRSIRLPNVRLMIGVAMGLAFLAEGAVILEALVRARLGAAPTAAPTRFYALPVVVQPGVTLHRDRLQASLERLGYTNARGRDIGIGEYRFGYRGWEIGRRAFRFDSGLEPTQTAIIQVAYDGQVRDVRDGRGRRLDYFMLEPEPLPSATPGSREDRVPVTLEDAPEHLIQAVLAIEDQRFYDHKGLDYFRIAGASVANARAGRVVQGGSTLTQQLVKNLFLTADRTFTRKLRETAMALVLEQRHTKEQILEAYLNEVYLGQHGGNAIHGVGRAAQLYFGKDVTSLELTESALLAGLIRGPNIYTPFRHPEAARERRDLVLSVMREQGTIDDATYLRAQAMPLQVRAAPEPLRAGRYFVDFVAQQLRERHGKGALRSGGTVITSLDFGLQLSAERAVREGLVALEREHRDVVREGQTLQAALVALDPHTGDVLAMVGGRDYGQSQFNRATDAQRQPGSAFKPIVALTALSYENEYTLATLVDDDSLSVETRAGIWQPVNYDGQFRGPVTIREALERSLNVPFARLGLSVGPEAIAEMGERLGISSRLQPVPSLALGASEVTPLELTRAFAVLAAGGFRADLRETIIAVNDEGKVLEQRAPSTERVVDEAVAYLVTAALEGAVERGTGRGLRGFGIYTPLAAKSGTTNDWRDGWFLAYTPRMVVGVWVGFDDGSPMGLTGSRAALPIVGRVLREAVGGRDGHGEFPVPRDIEFVEIDRETGLRAGWGCGGEREAFIVGTAPEESCSRSWNARSRRSGRDDRRGNWIDELRRRIGRN